MSVSASHVAKVLGAEFPRAEVTTPPAFGVLRECVSKHGWRVFTVGEAVMVCHRVQADGQPEGLPGGVEAVSREMDPMLAAYGEALAAQRYLHRRETIAPGYPVLRVYDRAPAPTLDP